MTSRSQACTRRSAPEIIGLPVRWRVDRSVSWTPLRSWTSGSVAWAVKPLLLATGRSPSSPLRLCGRRIWPVRMARGFRIINSHDAASSGGRCAVGYSTPPECHLSSKVSTSQAEEPGARRSTPSRTAEEKSRVPQRSRRTTAQWLSTRSRCAVRGVAATATCLAAAEFTSSAVCSTPLRWSRSSLTCGT